MHTKSNPFCKLLWCHFSYHEAYVCYYSSNLYKVCYSFCLIVLFLSPSITWVFVKVVGIFLVITLHGSIRKTNKNWSFHLPSHHLSHPCPSSIFSLSICFTPHRDDGDEYRCGHTDPILQVSKNSFIRTSLRRTIWRVGKRHSVGPPQLLFVLFYLPNTMLWTLLSRLTIYDVESRTETNHIITSTMFDDKENRSPTNRVVIFSCEWYLYDVWW
jgi:hypothetical protein